MRVIGGWHKGRRLATIRGAALRPTADRIREAVFNIIGNRVMDANVLDLYAGTGALGIEALSRGAARAVFVDRSPAALGIIKKNVAACQFQTRCRIFQFDAAGQLDRLPDASPPYDLIFMDPPYDRGCVTAGLKALKTFDAVTSRTLLIVEHSRREPLPTDLAPMVLTDQRRYGKTLVSFFTYML